jgi:hypothetical protein
MRRTGGVTSPSHPIGLTDAVGLTPSLLPRLGAVAITVTTTALDRVSGVVCGDACVPEFGCGLAVWRVIRLGWGWF